MILTRALTFARKVSNFASGMYVENSVRREKQRQFIADKLNSPSTAPNIQDYGFSSYSQDDEDGILLYIFSLIGTTNKIAIEMCCGAGLECNSANLIAHHGWKCILFDGDELKIKIGSLLYKALGFKVLNQPQIVHAWINAENVNALIKSRGISGEIDLLSIDIDGMDYWVWDAISEINPRVVIIEYNIYWGSEKSVTVPYDESFVRIDVDGTSYCGASLSAFVKLGKKLGYRLVGSNSAQFNAFFVREDIGVNVLPEVTSESCLSKHVESLISENAPQNYPNIVSKEWVEV